jgi:hypothetical protein
MARFFFIFYRETEMKEEKTILVFFINDEIPVFEKFANSKKKKNGLLFFDIIVG